MSGDSASDDMSAMPNPASRPEKAPAGMLVASESLSVLWGNAEYNYTHEHYPLGEDIGTMEVLRDGESATLLIQRVTMAIGCMPRSHHRSLDIGAYQVLGGR